MLLQYFELTSITAHCSVHMPKAEQKKALDHVEANLMIPEGVKISKLRYSYDVVKVLKLRYRQ